MIGDIKTYTVKELEDILKVKSKSIRDYINQGKLRASKVGRGWIIRHEDLEKFIEQNS